MKKQIKIFMSGALVVIPLAITIWLVSKVGGMLASMGSKIIVKTKLADGIDPDVASWIGVGLVLLVIYLTGLLTRLWVFRRIFGVVDSLMSKLPGIKTIYESIRDLMELFGGNAEKMGYPVLYSPPNSGFRMLGIVTNENPQGKPENEDCVIVFLPMGYMIGGPIVFASRDSIERLDMPVETALKLAATAYIAKNKPNQDSNS